MTVLAPLLSAIFPTHQPELIDRAGCSTVKNLTVFIQLFSTGTLQIEPLWILCLNVKPLLMVLHTGYYD